MAHIAAGLRAGLQQFPERVATICGDRQHTARMFAERVAALSEAFVDTGVAGPGLPPAALLGMGTDRYFEAILAVAAAGAQPKRLHMAMKKRLKRNLKWHQGKHGVGTGIGGRVRAGGVAAPLNWRWTPTECERACKLLGCTAILADETCWDVGLEVQQKLQMRHCVQLGGARNQPEERGRAVPSLSTEMLIQDRKGAQLRLRRRSDEVAMVVFTSGTTSGQAKGVMLTHASFLVQSLAKMQQVGYCAEDVYLHTAPLFHIGGLSSGLAMLAAGATHVFMPRFTAAATQRLIQQHAATALIAVPAMLVDLLDAAPPQRFCSVRRLLVGGGALPLQLQRRAHAAFPNARLASAYGMTEACSSITFRSLNPPPDPPAPSGTAAGACVGIPAPGLEVAVVLTTEPGPHTVPDGAGTGEAKLVFAAVGMEGEVVTRGAHTMRGYWAEPGGSRAEGATQLPGGWLRTVATALTAELDIDLHQSISSEDHARLSIDDQDLQHRSQTTQVHSSGPGSITMPIWVVGINRPGPQGDVGFLDDRGHLWLQGRMKDVIKTGGENVHASEVEAALLQHPCIRTAIILGTPDPRLGERVSAVLLLHPSPASPVSTCTTSPSATPGSPPPAAHRNATPNERRETAPSPSRSCAEVAPFQLLPRFPGSNDASGRLSLQEIHQFCRARGLSGFKLPRLVVVADGPERIPQNSSGKVVKVQLCQHLLQWLTEAQPRVQDLPVGGPVQSRL